MYVCMYVEKIKIAFEQCGGQISVELLGIEIFTV